MNQSVNHGGDCRTALATPGLLNIVRRTRTRTSIKTKTFERVCYLQRHFQFAAAVAVVTSAAAAVVAEPSAASMVVSASACLFFSKKLFWGRHMAHLHVLVGSV